MYDIETKCIHLEEKGETCDKSGAISFPIYQTQPMHTQDWEKVQDMIIAVCKILQENRWKRLLQIQRGEQMQLHFQAEWQLFQR